MRPEPSRKANVAAHPCPATRFGPLDPYLRESERQRIVVEKSPRRPRIDDPKRLRTCFSPLANRPILNHGPVWSKSQCPSSRRFDPFDRFDLADRPDRFLQGNLVTKTASGGSQTTYAWDTRNRLTGVNAAGVRTTYVYDALDRLIQTSQSGTTRATLYDGQTPYLDFNGSGATTARYLSAPGAIDAVLARETTGGVTAWYLADRQGTVRDLVNNSGTVIDRVDYGAFGDVVVESSPSNGDRFKYAGMELDSTTGLYYDRARWYDPKGGKFLNQDPIGFGGGDANIYRYVGNGATNSTDPTGLADFTAGGVPYKWPTSLMFSWSAFTNTIASYAQTTAVTASGGLGGASGGTLSGGGTGAE